jgi:hypothetical protein
VSSLSSLPCDDALARPLPRSSCSTSCASTARE